MKEKILINGLSENNKIRGVERVCTELIQRLSQDDDVYLLCGKWQLYYLEVFPLERIIFADCDQSKLSRYIFLLFKVFNIYKEFDVVHFINTMPVFLLPKKTRLTSTIHDIAEFDFPEKYNRLQSFVRRVVTKRLISKSYKLVTISHYTAGRIVDLFGCKKNQIDIIYNGVELPAVDFNQIQIPTTRSDFVSCGVIEKTKGLDYALKAFTYLKDRKKIDPAIKFHVVGGRGNLYDSLKGIFERSDVIEHGYLDNADLIALYLQCKVFVFLSEYEGFGLPPLEAYPFVESVLVSDTSAVKEVNQGFATISPMDNISIQDNMVNLIVKLDDKKDVTSKLEHVTGTFSWDVAAQKYRNFFNQVKGK